MKQIQQTVLQIAPKFLGLIEKPNNSGFYDHEGIFSLTGMQPEELMLSMGWQKGWAWCGMMPEIIWKIAYAKFDSIIIDELDKLFSPSVAQTMANFERSGKWLINDTPDYGSIAIWRYFDKNGNMKQEGHEGLVFNFAHDFIQTYDGNTNAAGGREGVEFAAKKRVLDFTPRPGLVLRGFIHLRDV
jgi:hypothetical protein